MGISIPGTRILKTVGEITSDFVRGAPARQLGSDDVAFLMKAANGELDMAHAQTLLTRGSNIDDSVRRVLGVSDTIGGVPKLPTNGKGPAIDAGKAIDELKEFWGGVKLRWRDKHFERNLRNALAKEEALLPQARKALGDKQAAVAHVEDGLKQMQKVIDKMDQDIRLALQRGDEATATALTQNKIIFQNDFEVAQKELAELRVATGDLEVQITAMEGRINFDRANVEKLAALKRAQKAESELGEDAQEAYKAVQKMQGDIARLEDQLRWATTERHTRVDQILKGGGFRAPGTGVPNGELDKRVADELNRIKKELGTATA